MPALCVPGFYVFDLLWCHLHQTDTIFLTAVAISVCNMMATAVDRYLAFCKPFLYMKIGSVHRKLFFLFMYLPPVLFVFIINVQLTEYVNGSCEFVNRARLKVLSKLATVSWLATTYFIPFLVLTLLYTLIVVKLKS